MPAGISHLTEHERALRGKLAIHTRWHNDEQARLAGTALAALVALRKAEQAEREAE